MRPAAAGAAAAAGNVRRGMHESYKRGAPRPRVGDLRRDYISDRVAIMAGPRAAGSAPPPGAAPESSPMAPGNESKTNPSHLSLVVRDGVLQRRQDADGMFVTDWAVRAFESSSPVVSRGAEGTYTDQPAYSEPAYGHHLTVAAVPSPGDTMSSAGIEQWSNILIAVQDCVRWMYAQKGVTYVAVYADHKAEAGSYDPYPHAEIVSFPAMPPVVDAEVRAHRRIASERGVCPVCDMMDPDRVGARDVLRTSLFSAFCPWAPSHPYEFWICPKKHVTSFARMTQKEINDLALMVRATLGGMARSLKDPPYTVAFHLSAEKKASLQLHWHIEVYPVTEPRTGLERGFGVHVHRTTPEDAASVLGAASRREMARLVGIT